MRRAQRGDPRAREALVAALMPRVVAAARRHSGGATELADLIQEGVLAALEALLRFDPDRGTPFWGYAGPWVRGAMARFAHDQRRALRLPPRAMSQLAALKEAESALRRREGREPPLARVAREAGVELSRARAILDAARAPGSLEGPLGDGEDGSSLRDVIADPRAEAAYDEVVAGGGAGPERPAGRAERARAGGGGAPLRARRARGGEPGRDRARPRPHPRAHRQIESRALRKMRVATGVEAS